MEILWNSEERLIGGERRMGDDALRLQVTLPTGFEPAIIVEREGRAFVMQVVQVSGPPRGRTAAFMAELAAGQISQLFAGSGRVGANWMAEWREWRLAGRHYLAPKTGAEAEWFTFYVDGSQVTDEAGVLSLGQPLLVWRRLDACFLAVTPQHADEFFYCGLAHGCLGDQERARAKLAEGFGLYQGGEAGNEGCSVQGWCYELALTDLARGWPAGDSWPLLSSRLGDIAGFAAMMASLQVGEQDTDGGEPLDRLGLLDESE